MKVFRRLLLTTLFLYFSNLVRNVVLVEDRKSQFFKAKQINIKHLKAKRINKFSNAKNRLFPERFRVKARMLLQQKIADIKSKFYKTLCCIVEK